MSHKISPAGRNTILTLFILGLLLGAASAQTLQVLYSFCAQKNCTDGNTPQSKLVSDQKGNLYGTTDLGGVNFGNCDHGGAGCGVVFKITPQRKETVLYSFCPQTGCTDGADPQARLVFDQKGNLYGVTQYGGAHNNGAIFKLTP